MKHYSMVYSLYKSITNGRIAYEIYVNCPGRLRTWLWVLSILYCIGTVPLFYFEAIDQSIWYVISAFAALFCIYLPWFYVLVKARKATFPEYFSEWGERIEYYQRGYAFIRYLRLVEAMKRKNLYNIKKIQRVREFIAKDIGILSDEKKPINPFISYAAAIILTLSATQISGWNAAIVWSLVLMLGVIVSVVRLIDALPRGERCRLNELDRFLFWCERDLEQEEDYVSESTGLKLKAV